MMLSLRGQTLLKDLEGLRLTAYPDGKGKWSVGYGHNGVPAGTVITRAEADAYFASDVKKFEAAVTAAVTYASQQQYDALVIFAYNVGTAGMSNSTAVQLHNAGNFQGAADALRMWRLSEGKVHPGLVARRERERQLYLTGDYGPVRGLPGVPPAPVRLPVAGLLVACGAALLAYRLLPRLAPVRRLLGAS